MYYNYVIINMTKTNEPAQRHVFHDYVIKNKIVAKCFSHECWVLV